jgi:hypothetical protein
MIMLLLPIGIALLLVAQSTAAVANLRGRYDVARELQLGAPSSYYYYSTSDPAILGAKNLSATLGNPLKGLVTMPRWAALSKAEAAEMPNSLDFYYLAMDDAMVGENSFNWTVYNNTINEAARRNNHVIWRVFIHYPKSELRLPQYLLDANVTLYNRTDDNGKIGYAPSYNDPLVLKAMENFIAAFGKAFDGNKGLAFLQVGLLGKWGEWHTFPQKGYISNETQRSVAGWYQKAFAKTPLQVRYPDKLLMIPGAGVHDDSFASTTIGDPGNTWPDVQKFNQTSFWKTAVMGGETLPQLQPHVFKPEYKRGYVYRDPNAKSTTNITFKEDFFECVNTTHATYMVHYRAFNPDRTGYDAAELAIAQRAHVTMGYNFEISNVAVAASGGATVAVDEP